MAADDGLTQLVATSRKRRFRREIVHPAPVRFGASRGSRPLRTRRSRRLAARAAGFPCRAQARAAQDRSHQSATAPLPTSLSSTSPMTTCRSWSIRPWRSSTNLAIESASCCTRSWRSSATPRASSRRFADKAVPDAGAIRESLMHIHIARLSDEDGRKLEGELQAILADVRTAVLDWRAMQQRLQGCHRQLSDRIRRPSRSRI